MASYTIKDLERLSGIKAHTIRIWEKRYGIIEPKRTSTNIRTYCDDELKKILNVSILNKNGIKISNIASLSVNEIGDRVGEILENQSDTDGHIESLILAMVEYDEDRFEKLLSRSIIQLGFEDTVIQVLYPFFVRIGVMWQTNSINVAQEHFISNLVRQKLIVAIDSQIPEKNDDSKKAVLFLPEGELHELGLLFYAYILKKRGHKLIYLGQSVPLVDVRSVLHETVIDFVVTSVVINSDFDVRLDYLKTVLDNLNDKPLFISGYHAEEFTSKLEGVQDASSPKEFIRLLEAI